LREAERGKAREGVDLKGSGTGLKRKFFMLGKRRNSLSGTPIIPVRSRKHGRRIFVRGKKGADEKE